MRILILTAWLATQAFSADSCNTTQFACSVANSPKSVCCNAGQTCTTREDGQPECQIPPRSINQANKAKEKPAKATRNNKQRSGK